jgi:hypothetical protein
VLPLLYAVPCLFPVFPAALARLTAVVRRRKEPDGCFVDSHAGTSLSAKTLSHTNPDAGFRAECGQGGEHVADDPADAQSGELVEYIGGTPVSTTFSEGVTDLGVGHEANKSPSRKDPKVPSSPEILEHEIAKT